MNSRLIYMIEALVKAGLTLKGETWAFLHVSPQSEIRIRNFFIEKHNIEPRYVSNNLHLTIYFAEHLFDDLKNNIRNCNHKFSTENARFMVMKPGGENPDPKLLPAKNKVAIRIQKISSIREIIEQYRELLTCLETEEILGGRNFSTRTRSAYGAPNFQPHITLLKPGNGIKDLQALADDFRENIKVVYFDRFEIKKC